MDKSHTIYHYQKKNFQQTQNFKQTKVHPWIPALAKSTKKAMFVIVMNLCLYLLLAGCTDITLKEKISTKESISKESTHAPLRIAIQRYWPDSEGNRAVDIFGKFNTQEEMAATLRLDNVIGTFHDRTWVLADILVSMDFNANGDVAGWIVSGPEPLISAYIQYLQGLYKQDRVFYDFFVGDIKVEPYGCLWDIEDH